jgi:RNA polymerase sigma factor (sigma-70 family)
MDKSFEDLLEDPNIVNIMNKVSLRYNRHFHSDDVRSIQLGILWRCVSNYDDSKGAKFTTYLHNQLNYAFKSELKKKRPDHHLGDIHPDVRQKENHSIEVHDLVSGLPNHISRILMQRFLYNMTMVEIGRANGYSRETARRRLRNAIKICKKKHHDLI